MGEKLANLVNHEPFTNCQYSQPHQNVLGICTDFSLFAKFFLTNRFYLYTVKMKYWREYYLAKCIEKHFGKINIGNLDEMQYNMTHIYYYWWNEFLVKLPIAKVYSLPVFHLIR